MNINVVLVEPEIPQNTGNIARTCAATGVSLHLVRPLGFSTDDRYLRRAGLDYWDKLDIHYHDGIDAFMPLVADGQGAEAYFLSTKGGRSYTDIRFGGAAGATDAAAGVAGATGVAGVTGVAVATGVAGMTGVAGAHGAACVSATADASGAAGAIGAPCYLVFGKETAGLPESLLREHADRCFRIPMRGGIRSLNLSNAVAVVVYEAMRQTGFLGLEQEGFLCGIYTGERKDIHFSFHNQVARRTET